MMKMEKKDSSTDTNLIYGIVGISVFAILTIIIPFLKILGGFIQISADLGFGSTLKFDFYWDVVSMKSSTWGFTQTTTAAYTDFTSEFTDLEIIWNLIPLWGIIGLVIGLLGVVLVLIHPMKKLRNIESTNTSLSVIGLIAGLIATGVEYGLFILLFFLEDWETLLNETSPPELNIILLVCFVIGWIALVVGYNYTTKE